LKKWYGPKYKLTYFNIEGLGEKIRLAFLLNGVEFEDNRVAWKDWPEVKKTVKFG